MDQSLDAKRIERVVLACVQCRSRHVKCGAEQPVCNRCKRDGKECVYQKSRRGGLDKAALARRRLRLQQEAEITQHGEATSQDSTTSEQHSSSDLSDAHPSLNVLSSNSSNETTPLASSHHLEQNYVAFQIDNDRLLELYFDNFWPSFPIVLPSGRLQARRLQANHGMTVLLSVLQWIGSMYAPWVPSEPYYETALKAMDPLALAHTPFNVQALMLFALGQFHCNYKAEARKMLGAATTMALALGMNERNFAQAYSGGDPVLAESWRRTYYMLYITDQHFAVVTNTPFYPLLSVPNNVDLPCDDEYYESGQIPPMITWAEYLLREFAEVEVVYSSITYLYDVGMVIAYIMNTFLETSLVTETMVENCDTKLAIWSSLLPACKKDPVRLSGEVDEVMFMAHMCLAITMSTIHRPFSSLAHCPGEMSTQAFMPPSPFTLVPKSGRNAHTARVLKATEMQTKLLAIPCALEKHNIFTMCVTARIAAVQVSACTHLLDGHALSIARDRVRLSIGFLKTMGATWALGKQMARELQAIARLNLSRTSTAIQQPTPMEAGPVTAEAEFELPRDELICPVDPSAQIDIYAGLTIPVDWETTPFGYTCQTSAD